MASLLRAMLIGCALGAAATDCLAVEIYSEPAVKAAFIFRFTAYVEWPEEAMRQGSFTIAVLGDAEIAERLKVLTEGRVLRNHRVQVRRIAQVRDAAEVHVLYVGRDRRADLRSLLAPLAGRPILIISDDVEGLEAGSAVNFLEADNRVRFEVSLPAAQRARLKISSELLSVAARVQQ